MPRFKIGDTIFLEGRRATIVWLSENANEIEAMDEYIVQFDNKQTQFVVSSTLTANKTQPVHDGKHDTDRCHGQTY